MHICIYAFNIQYLVQMYDAYGNLHQFNMIQIYSKTITLTDTLQWHCGFVTGFALNVFIYICTYIYTFGLFFCTEMSLIDAQI